jgi:tRNA pseudouridine38-40 synthase
MEFQPWLCFPFPAMPKTHKPQNAAAPRRNIRLTIQYEGTRYCGWQRQPNGLSIQQAVEDALLPVNGAPVRLLGSGRTDAGVHALGQIANFHTNATHSPETFLRAANTVLPRDIAIVEADEVPLEFNSRRDARIRWYRYRISTDKARPLFDRRLTLHCPHPLDAAKARQAARIFEGRHNFAGFRSVKCAAKRTELEMQDCVLRIDGGQWTLDLRCRSFLHNMVRIIAGSIIQAARGKLALADIEKALETGKRQKQSLTAPSRGLTLMAVGYPPEKLAARQMRRSARAMPGKT